ncbi:uncharacterized protein [Solanum lycopersicum]|uniref:uncharacterized protein isoform X1 n=1 Tax=Solanum lycopersicum TaxID=4081 RepID=UPI0037494F07
MRTTSYLDSKQELVMPEIGYQLLHNCTDQIQNWVWICNIHSQASRSFTRQLVSLPWWIVLSSNDAIQQSLWSLLCFLRALKKTRATTLSWERRNHSFNDSQLH